MDKSTALYYIECKFAGQARMAREATYGSNSCRQGDFCPNASVAGNSGLNHLKQQSWFQK